MAVYVAGASEVQEGSRARGLSMARKLPIFERNGYWYCHVRYPDGTRRQRALHIRNDGSPASRRAAEAAYWQEQSRATSGIELGRSKARTIRSALTALAEAKEADELTEHSHIEVDSGGKALEAHFGDQHDIGSITTEDLVTFALARKQMVKPVTVKRDFQVYSQACAAVGVTPAKLPGIGKTAAAAQQPFTLDEVRRFMVATSPQSKLLAYSLHFCGLRNSETRKLDEPDWETKRVWCRGTKTKGSARWIFPPDEMWEYMTAQRSCGEWRGWPKLGKQGVLSFVWRTSIRAGIGRRHPNDCRGGFATRLAIAGVPAGVRGALMGNSEKTQAIYSLPATDQDALAKAMLMHPRVKPKQCTAEASTESAATAKTAAGGSVFQLKTAKTPEN